VLTQLCHNLFRCNSSSIHIFPALNPASPSPITTLTQSPAIDVIAVGHLDGTVRVVDIKDGEEVLKVRMEGNTGEGIVGVAFRMGEYYIKLLLLKYLSNLQLSQHETA
jgi:WD40 repeat protein